MRPINKSASRTMRALVAGLAPGESRIIDTSKAYMALHVERLDARTYSLAHYFDQNGDRMADPDVVFHLTGGEFYPYEITQHALGLYACHARFDAAGVVTHLAAREQRDLAVFAGHWLENLRAQQGLK